MRAARERHLGADLRTAQARHLEVVRAVHIDRIHRPSLRCMIAALLTLVGCGSLSIAKDSKRKTSRGAMGIRQSSACCQRRSLEQRKADTLTALGLQRDLWLATTDGRGR